MSDTKTCLPNLGHKCLPSVFKGKFCPCLFVIDGEHSLALQCPIKTNIVPSGPSAAAAAATVMVSG